MARLAVVALVIVASTVVAAPAIGIAQQTGVAADIRQGNCDELGDIVAPLVEARIPEGTQRGNAAGMPAANSFTTVPISLAALTASEHAIVVPFPVGEELVVCGEIGGALTEGGSLIVGIGSPGDLDISGIAYLSPGADPARTNISLFITGEGLDTFLAATFLPPKVISEQDAARFAAALAARDDASRLAGPFAGQLVQREGVRVKLPAGITTADFSATVTFTSPTQPPETPWDIGFAFQQSPGHHPVHGISVFSNGGQFYADASSGLRVSFPSTAFDATPGATNTLDLVVEGATALLGINGEIVNRIDLAPRAPANVFITTGISPEDIVEGRAIPYSDFTVWGLPGTTAQATAPEAAAAQDDAARFAAAAAARQGSRSLAGPLGGTLHQSQRGLAGVPSGITTEDFSATVTFVNPRDPSGVPWDIGLAFHMNPAQSTVQEIYLDANGWWYYTDFPAGIQQSGPALSFDAAPGAMNTLDLIVQGETALFGVNGQFLASLDLPPATAADVLAATDFESQNLVEGREIIYSGFQVWNASPPESLAAPPLKPVESDAVRFAAALAAQETRSPLAGPFAGTFAQHEGSYVLKPAGISTEDFAATVAFTNPAQQTETPWDVGFVFHRTQDASQAVYIDSTGFWYRGGTRSGWTPAFDATPSTINTLDLVVDGSRALFGVNGEFVASFDLTSATASDVFVGAGFFSGHAVEGRAIAYSAFTVWG
jgi:hypothetical protein